MKLRSLAFLAALSAVACDAPSAPLDVTMRETAATEDLRRADRRIRAIDLGGNYGCALVGIGNIMCWGGSPGANNDAAPREWAPMTGRFVGLTVASSYTCGLRSDGAVECRQLAFAASHIPPVQTPITGKFVQVAVGNGHTCAVRDDGVIECWGSNAGGQAPATKSAASGSFTQVAVNPVGGGSHTCALRTDGVVECWGGNTFGQAPATKTATAGKFTWIAVGASFSCAVRDDGSIECWGRNNEGQAPALKTPVTAAFVKVRTGEGAHACATRSDGAVECWGLTQEGAVPAVVTPTGSAFEDVAGGAGSTCALRVDDEIECWGADYAGEANPPFGDDFRFSGFYGKLLNASYPDFNVIELRPRGRVIGIRFSLGSDEGMGIIEAGYPQYLKLSSCATGFFFKTGTDAATGQLTFHPNEGRGTYRYAWEVPKNLPLGCYQLIFRFSDGAYRRVNFQFEAAD